MFEFRERSTRMPLHCIGIPRTYASFLHEVLSSNVFQLRCSNVHPGETRPCTRRGKCHARCNLQNTLFSNDDFQSRAGEHHHTVENQMHVCVQRQGISCGQAYTKTRTECKNITMFSTVSPPSPRPPLPAPMIVMTVLIEDDVLSSRTPPKTFTTAISFLFQAACPWQERTRVNRRCGSSNEPHHRRRQVPSPSHSTPATGPLHDP